MADISLMVAQYGNYYRNNGTIGKNNLHRHTFDRTNTKKLFTIRPTENTIIDNATIKVDDVVQAFYNKFSPKGKLTFEPNVWQLGHVKINDRITPDEYAGTVLDFLNTKTPSRLDAPILALTAEYYLQKAQENIEDKIVFKGVKAVPSTTDQNNGVAGTTIGARDGIRKVIRDYNTAGKLIDENGNSNVIVMGAMPTTPALMVEYIDTFYWALPELQRSMIKAIAVKKSAETLYKRGMSNKNLYYEKNAPSEFAFIENTDCAVVGLDSMTGSNMMWCSPSVNNLGFMKNGNNAGIMDIWQSGIYTVDVATDWWEGENFVTPMLVYVSDQDLTA